MKLTTNELSSFALAELDSYNLTGFNVRTDLALKEMKGELVEELESLNTQETKEARLNYFKIKGAKVCDYAERILELDGNRRVIYGIRNKGGNPEVPFVQIRPNFQIKDRIEALEIYKVIEAKFKVFEPKYLSFHSSQRVRADFYGSIHMVATTTSICSIEKWPREDAISFEDISDDSYYAWYKDGYEEFHRQVPELKEKVPLNDLPSMMDSLKQGLLKFVLLDGEHVGLIAGEKSNFLASTGIYFLEIFISQRFKGHGLAKAIQRKFIEKFCRELAFTWGTIDMNNLPSYKTAQANGRKAVRYECFVNL